MSGWRPVIAVMASSVKIIGGVSVIVEKLPVPFSVNRPRVVQGLT